MEKSYGQIAYEAYFNRARGVSLVSKCPLPSWEEQTIDIQDAWEAAAEAVIDERVKRILSK